MKSKEALENWYNTDSLNTKAYEYELHYRLIKRDLEILEIIKQRLKISGYYDKIYWSPYITPQEINYTLNGTECSSTLYMDWEEGKIKEWLKKDD